MSQEFINPTIYGKNILYLRLFTIFLIVCLFYYLGRPMWFGYIETLPYCEQLHWIKLYIIWAMLLPIIIAPFSIYYAYKIVKLNQYPLPNSLVFRKTLIRHGKCVKIRSAIVSITVIILLLFSAIGFNMLKNNKVFMQSCSITLLHK